MSLRDQSSGDRGMSNTPERIWAEPGMPGYLDEASDVYTVEYIRRDTITPAMAAEVLLDDQELIGRLAMAGAAGGTWSISEVLRAIAAQEGD